MTEVRYRVYERCEEDGYWKRSKQFKGTFGEDALPFLLALFDTYKAEEIFISKGYTVKGRYAIGKETLTTEWQWEPDEGETS
jgi:hypothetical protein